MGGPLDPSAATGSAGVSVRCPYCGGTDTEREHGKGPSLCRSMHYCNRCREVFEALG